MDRLTNARFEKKIQIRGIFTELAADKFAYLYSIETR